MHLIAVSENGISLTRETKKVTLFVCLSIVVMVIVGDFVDGEYGGGEGEETVLNLEAEVVAEPRGGGGGGRGERRLEEKKEEDLLFLREGKR